MTEAGIKSQESLYHKEKGNDAFKSGQLEAAIEHYTKGIETDPKQPTIFANRAMCYLKNKRFTEAKEDCDKALILDSTYVKAYYRRGMAQLSLGNLDQAQMDFKMILVLEPQNIDARKELNKLQQPDSKPEEYRIFPVDKPEHLRSKKPLRKVQITEVNSAIADDFTSKLDTVAADLEGVTITNGHTVAEDTVPNGAVSDVKTASEVTVADTVPQITEVPKVPETCYQFLTDWDSIRKYPEILSKYFKQIPPSDYNRLFADQLDDGMLCDLIVAMETSADDADWLERLGQLTTVNRVETAAMFLDEKWRKRFATCISGFSTENETAASKVRNVFML